MGFHVTKKWYEQPSKQELTRSSYSGTAVAQLVCIQGLCISYGVTRAQARNVLAMVPITEYRNRNNWYVADQVENVIAKKRLFWVASPKSL